MVPILFFRSHQDGYEPDDRKRREVGQSSPATAKAKITEKNHPTNGQRNERTGDNENPSRRRREQENDVTKWQDDNDNNVKKNAPPRTKSGESW